MNLRSIFKKRLVALGSGAAVVALAAGGIAYAASASASASAGATGTATVLRSVTSTTGASTTPSGPASARHRGRSGHLLRLLRRTIHAELTVRTRDGYRTIDIDRGRLQSDASGTITIVRPDGVTVKAQLTSRTRFPLLSSAELKPGDRVVLIQSSGDALAVRARSSDGGA